MPSLFDRLPQRQALESLWDCLPEARLVGGCVRDLLRGEAVHDIDLATPEPPETVMAGLTAAGFRVIPTGLAHGTVTAVIAHTPYEITTLRRDDETDGRHALVSWTADWSEDAARRDFTINAMSLDRLGGLHDYFGGQADLSAHRVRFVGDASRRITEDSLRALRFFRFDARFGGAHPDDEACRAITQHLDLVGRLSAERIASELMRILSGPRVMHALSNMMRTGLLPRLIPHVRLDLIDRLLVTNAPNEPRLRLFALSPDHAGGLAERLKLSNDDKAMLSACASSVPVLDPDQDDNALRRARAAQRLDWLIARSWLVQAEQYGAPDPGWERWRDRVSALPQPVFPLGGADALKSGVSPGPDMGRWLKTARDWWLAEGCMPTAEACLAYMRTLL